MRTLHAPTVEDTHRAGARLGAAAAPGTVVALIGDLGAGKTEFARGVARGLGVPGTVRSPTFILVDTHEGGRLPLWHADLYRLHGDADLEQLGLEDLLDVGVVLVEWAERCSDLLPDDHLRVVLTDAPGGGRLLSVDATGPRHAPLEEAVCG